MTTNKLGWGILSTGVIAHTLARALAKSKTSELRAIASRSPASAAAFAAEFGVAKSHGSYEALLDDPDVDVVYIATPHPMHRHWTILAARAKKHVLCEKPLGMNHAEVSAMVEAARANDVFLMEAFMYRCHPQTEELRRLLRSGTLGRVKAIQASFGFDGAFRADGRLLSNELGGGGILDVGCYPVSMARLVAGIANQQPFTEPSTVQAMAHVGARSQVDEYAFALLEFPGEIIASLGTSVQLWQDNVVRIFGSEGRLLLREPWHPALDRDASEIIIERPGREPETLRVQTEDSVYGYEIEAVAAQIEQREAWQMSLSDSLGNALTLDRWRRAVGVSYVADAVPARGARET